MYINGNKVTVLDIFDTEDKASKYASYIIENIKFDGELSLFKVGEPVELEVEDELTELVNETLVPTSLDINEQCSFYVEDKSDVVNVIKSNDKSKIKTTHKKLRLRKENKRTKIQIRFSRKGNK